MKVMNIKDIEKFMQVVSECSGTVELITEDGDVLNLKSKLTRFVALEKMLGADADFVKTLHLRAHNAADTARLMDFMMNGSATPRLKPGA